jgi:hypothetical protein
VLMASQKGTTNTTRIVRVMTVTASVRLFHNLACTRRMMGQVAIATITAQIAAGRKGLRTQRLPAIRARMNRTARVVRVRSWRSSAITNPSPSAALTATQPNEAA